MTVGLSELLRTGLLHEINRLILHPAGYSLSVTRDGRGVALSSAPDFSLPEALLSPEKANSVRGLVEGLEHPRRLALGYSVQPCPGARGAPLTLADDDETVGFFFRLAEAAVQASKEGTDEDLFDHLLLWFVPALTSLRVGQDGRVALERPPPAEPDRLGPQQVGRAFYLAREVPRLAERHEVGGGVDEHGKPVKVFSETQLLPDETIKAREISARVLEWPPKGPFPTGAAEDLRALEELFALGQPGMLFWRGGRPDIKLGSPSIKEALALWRSARGELALFLAGEMPASALADPEAVRRDLETRLSPIETRLDELEVERRSLWSSAAPLRTALERLGP